MGLYPGFHHRGQSRVCRFSAQQPWPGNPLKCEYYLPTVVTEALETGKAEVKVLTTPDKWHGITYREDKPELVAALAAMHASGFYPKERLF